MSEQDEKRDETHVEQHGDGDVNVNPPSEGQDVDVNVNPPTNPEEPVEGDSE